MNVLGKVHRFDGRLVMVGFGCIGQGVLPLLLRHIDMRPEQLLILSADTEGAAVAQAHGVACERLALDAHNVRRELEPRIGRGDFVLNLSVNVSSVALIALCRAASLKATLRQSG